MKRRELLVWTSVGAFIALLSTSRAQGETQTSPIDVLPQAPTFSALGSITTLNEKGSVEGSVNGQNVIVIRDPSDETTLVARTADCNEGRCTINWDAETRQFVCPCDGSRFDLDGSVVQGPAQQPLQPLPAEIEQGQIMVLTLGKAAQ